MLREDTIPIVISIHIIWPAIAIRIAAGSTIWTFISRGNSIAIRIIIRVVGIIARFQIIGDTIIIRVIGICRVMVSVGVRVLIGRQQTIPIIIRIHVVRCAIAICIRAGQTVGALILCVDTIPIRVIIARIQIVWDTIIIRVYGIGRVAITIGVSLFICCRGAIPIIVRIHVVRRAITIRIRAGQPVGALILRIQTIAIRVRVSLRIQIVRDAIIIRVFCIRRVAITIGVRTFFCCIYPIIIIVRVQIIWRPIPIRIIIGRVAVAIQVLILREDAIPIVIRILVVGIIIPIRIIIFVVPIVIEVFICIQHPIAIRITRDRHRGRLLFRTESGRSTIGARVRRRAWFGAIALIPGTEGERRIIFKVCIWHKAQLVRTIQQQRATRHIYHLSAGSRNSLPFTRIRVIILPCPVRIVHAGHGNRLSRGISIIIGDRAIHHNIRHTITARILITRLDTGQRWGTSSIQHRRIIHCVDRNRRNSLLRLRAKCRVFVQAREVSRPPIFPARLVPCAELNLRRAIEVFIRNKAYQGCRRVRRQQAGFTFRRCAKVVPGLAAIGRVLPGAIVVVHTDHRNTLNSSNILVRDNVIVGATGEHIHHQRPVAVLLIFINCFQRQVAIGLQHRRGVAERRGTGFSLIHVQRKLLILATAITCPTAKRIAGVRFYHQVDRVPIQIVLATARAIGIRFIILAVDIIGGINTFAVDRPPALIAIALGYYVYRKPIDLTAIFIRPDVTLVGCTIWAVFPTLVLVKRVCTTPIRAIGNLVQRITANRKCNCVGGATIVIQVVGRVEVVVSGEVGLVSFTICRAPVAICQQVVATR